MARFSTAHWRFNFKNAHTLRKQLPFVSPVKPKVNGSILQFLPVKSMTVATNLQLFSTELTGYCEHIKWCYYTTLPPLAEEKEPPTLGSGHVGWNSASSLDTKWCRSCYQALFSPRPLVLGPLLSLPMTPWDEPREGWGPRAAALPGPPTPGQPGPLVEEGIYHWAAGRRRRRLVHWAFREQLEGGGGACARPCTCVFSRRDWFDLSAVYVCGRCVFPAGLSALGAGSAPGSFSGGRR